MILDLTLDSVKFPGLETFTPPFGTKKAANVGLTTQEGCDNIAKPWLDQRPLTISENSSFSDDIERNATIEIDTASITLSMDDATFKGCEIRLLTTFTSGTAAVLIGATSYTLQPSSLYRLIYDGITWHISNFSGDITTTNITVATTDWVDESDGGATPTYADYPWKAEITVNGVTAAHSPDVRFALADATAGVFAPVADTAAGKVLIYANAQPSAAVNIPAIICKKVG